MTFVGQHASYKGRNLRSIPTVPNGESVTYIDLSDNPISSFNQLLSYPNLRFLCIDNTKIVSFHHAPELPSLEEFTCRGTSLSCSQYIQLMAVMVFGDRMKIVNGMTIDQRTWLLGKAARAEYRKHLVEGYVFLKIDPIKMINNETRQRKSIFIDLNKLISKEVVRTPTRTRSGPINTNSLNRTNTPNTQLNTNRQSKNSKDGDQTEALVSYANAKQTVNKTEKRLKSQFALMSNRILASAVDQRSSTIQQNPTAEGHTHRKHRSRQSTSGPASQPIINNNQRRKNKSLNGQENSINDKYKLMQESAKHNSSNDLKSLSRDDNHVRVAKGARPPLPPANITNKRNSLNSMIVQPKSSQESSSSSSSSSSTPSNDENYQSLNKGPAPPSNSIQENRHSESMPNLHQYHRQHRHHREQNNQKLINDQEIDQEQPFEFEQDPRNQIQANQEPIQSEELSTTHRSRKSPIESINEDQSNVAYQQPQQVQQQEEPQQIQYTKHRSRKSLPTSENSNNTKSTENQQQQEDTQRIQNQEPIRHRERKSTSESSNNPVIIDAPSHLPPRIPNSPGHLIRRHSSQPINHSPDSQVKPQRSLDRLGNHQSISIPQQEVQQLQQEETPKPIENHEQSEIKIQPSTSDTSDDKATAQQRPEAPTDVHNKLSNSDSQKENGNEIQDQKEIENQIKDQEDEEDQIQDQKEDENHIQDQKDDENQVQLEEEEEENKEQSNLPSNPIEQSEKPNNKFEFTDQKPYQQKEPDSPSSINQNSPDPPKKSVKINIPHDLAAISENSPIFLSVNDDSDSDDPYDCLNTLLSEDSCAPVRNSSNDNPSSIVLELLPEDLSSDDASRRRRLAVAPFPRNDDS